MEDWGQSSEPCVSERAFWPNIWRLPNSNIRLRPLPFTFAQIPPVAAQCRWLPLNARLFPLDADHCRRFPLNAGCRLKPLFAADCRSKPLFTAHCRSLLLIAADAAQSRAAIALLCHHTEEKCRSYCPGTVAGLLSGRAPVNKGNKTHF